MQEDGDLIQALADLDYAAALEIIVAEVGVGIMTRLSEHFRSSRRIHLKTLSLRSLWTIRPTFRSAGLFYCVQSLLIS